MWTQKEDIDYYYLLLLLLLLKHVLYTCAQIFFITIKYNKIITIIIIIIKI